MFLLELTQEMIPKMKNKIKGNEQLLRCPVCNNKTRTKAFSDTILLNFPLFCPKCKQETFVNVQELNLMIINKSDAKSHDV